MNILVVGSGGREHAIAWKLSQSPQLSDLFAAPGNAGTAQLARNVPIGATDIEGLFRFAQESKIDLTVVGPEAPLAAGIADRFQEAGLLIFGPTQAASLIESSKWFAKELMLRRGVPTGTAETFVTYDEAARYVQSAPLPVVVKADGLTAGKGVVVARTREEATEALRQQMVEERLGEAGKRVLIEEHLQGQEVSVFAFVDGPDVSGPMVAACDYKRVGDGDRGPNTGGMGSFSPPRFWTPGLEYQVRAEIMEPVARALADRGNPYSGVLYAGLILTSEGPKVIEFNCRLGDPEAQVILPRLKTDLAEVMMRTARGALDGVSIEWDPGACVGVVLASGGYPGAYGTGYPIDGLQGLDSSVTVFHAGTKDLSPQPPLLGKERGRTNPTPDADGMWVGLVTDGGRVLTVTALGSTLEQARRKVYDDIGRIRFKDSFYRRDIATVEEQPSVSQRPHGSTGLS